MRERLYLFDTTLRDGAQTNGVDFTLNDKLAIAAMLDDLGIDYVEGGYPGANPTDTELFAQPRKLAATFTAFGDMPRSGAMSAADCVGGSPPSQGRRASNQARFRLCSNSRARASMPRSSTVSAHCRS